MRAPRHRRFELERLEDRSTPAGLDPAFGGGHVTLDLGGNDVPVATATQPDGKLLALSRVDSGGGTHAVLTRLNPDGTPDATFGTNGSETVPVSILGGTVFGIHDGDAAVTVLPDGRVVVATSYTESGPAGQAPVALGRFAVARFNPDGTPDATFGTNGVATFALPGAGQTFQNLVALPDGSLILVGPQYYDPTPPSVIPPLGFKYPTPDVVAVKLTPGGRLDTGFGTDGVATIDPGDLAAVDVRAAALPDGRVLVYGQVQGTLPGNTDPAGGIPGRHIFATRLTTAGAVDTTYGTGGWFKANPEGPANSVALAGAAAQADGSLVLAAAPQDVNVPNGAGRSIPYLFRLTPGGQIDQSYAGDGRLELDSPYFSDAPPQSQDASLLNMGGLELVGRPGGGVFVVAGRSVGLVVEGVKADGTIDDGFGSHGLLALPSPTLASGPLSLVTASADAAGRLVLFGYAGTTVRLDAVSNDVWAARISPDAPTPPLPPAPTPTQGTVSTVASLTGGSLVADVNGDGTVDTIRYAGPGGTEIEVIDGATGQPLVPAFAPYESGFTGGLEVAAADLDGDGAAELIVAPDVGGSARVQVFSYSGGRLVARDNFFAIDDPAFRGGARIATGDVNGDGRPDLTVGAGPGGGPRVVVFDGAGLTGSAAAPPKLVPDFYAFTGPDATGLRDGVTVALTDLNGDGKADFVFGAGPGGAPRVMVLDGGISTSQGVGAAQAAPVANFYAGGDQTSRGGAAVSVVNAAVPGAGNYVQVTAPATGVTRFYRPEDFATAGEPVGVSSIPILVTNPPPPQP